ncbi:MAG: AMP-binding protein, partial [Lachnospiraceae bacterium]|nr:AMP-binding protein [Lachnospiraceae bacterium]
MIKSVIDYLEVAVISHPDKLSIIDMTLGKITYKRLYEMSQYFAFEINKKHVHNQPVVILMEKSSVTVAAFFGCTYTNNIYVPLDPEMPVDRMKKIIDELKCEL